MNPIRRQDVLRQYARLILRGIFQRRRVFIVVSRERTMSRTIDEPLPDLVREYEEEVLGPLHKVIAKVQIQLGHVAGKNGSATAEDKATWEALYKELGGAMEAKAKGQATMLAKARAIESDAEYTRVMDAVTKVEGSLVDAMRKLAPIRDAIAKVGGRRSKTRKGRLTKKATRRGRKARS